MTEGWICPRCQTVYSPFIANCACRPMLDTSPPVARRTECVFFYNGCVLCGGNFTGGCVGHKMTVSVDGNST